MVQKMSNKEIELIIEMARTKQYDICIFGAGYLGKYLGRETLAIYGIHANFYCDNNRQLWGKQIIDDIVCEPLSRLKDSKNLICFVFVSGIATEIVMKQLNEIGVKYIISGIELNNLKKTRDYFFPFLTKKKIAIYTCITGDYDVLKEPEYISDKCDYYLISDKKPAGKSVFQYININNYLPDMELDNSKKNRYIKLHPHLIFPQYKYSIYIDGSIVIRGDICECVAELPKTRMKVLSKNYMDQYSETIRLMNDGMAEPDVLYSQIEKYYLEGMPMNYGNYFNGIIIREHNNQNCIKLMDDWWEELLKWSRRDQVSFPYVLWKNGYNADDVGVVSTNSKVLFMNDSPYFKFISEHNVDRKIEALLVNEKKESKFS